MTKVSKLGGWRPSDNDDEQESCLHFLSSFVFSSSSMSFTQACTRARERASTPANTRNVQHCGISSFDNDE
jgi:hypothetical protein